jgi:hypothetical protein
VLSDRKNRVDCEHCLIPIHTIQEREQVSPHDCDQTIWLVFLRFSDSFVRQGTAEISSGNHKTKRAEYG